MKKLLKRLLNSISDRLILLITVCFLMISGVFIFAHLYQNKKMSTTMMETNQRQINSISAYGEDMIERMVTQEMNRSTQLEAMVTNENFLDLENRVVMVAKFAADVLSAPEAFPPAKWAFPDTAKNGEVSAMIMLADGLDPEDPDTAARIGLIANMSEMMIDLCEAFGAENTYVALPEGIHLAATRNAAGWYQEDGTLQHFDPRERYWYKEAVAAEDLIFTDVGDDKETGQLCIVCATPVYGGDGELLAVVGSDFFLTEIQRAVESVTGDDEYHVIVNRNGQVIFSPQTEGELRATGDLHVGEGQASGTQALDLRNSENAELAAFMTDVMQGNGAARAITLEDRPYYVAAAPIPTVGWREISVFSQEKANETMRAMMDAYDEIETEALTSYRTERFRFRLYTSVAIVLELVAMMALVMVQGRKIVEPLNLITKRISETRGDEMEFKMEEAYRTGDEIEVLAGAFSDLTRKTAEYVEQVRVVTAEKERIGSELKMAREIQASVLPSDFPAFPDRPEVDIYAIMDPAKEVGGDFYDFFFIDPDHLAMLIADVSGKGVPAALFMMISRAILKNCAMMGQDAAQILEEANRVLCSENSMEMFVTVWIGILEISTGRVVTANAGHENPVVYRASDGSWTEQKEKHGFVLGGIETSCYRESEFRLEPGDRIFVYTDGLPEAENEEGAFFGTERMMEVLRQSSPNSPEEVLGTLRGAVNGFVGQAEQFDDLTMLCVEYHGSGAET